MREWTSPRIVRWLGWLLAGLITGANAWLALTTAGGVLQSQRWTLCVMMVYAAALAYVALTPLKRADVRETQDGFVQPCAGCELGT